MKRYFIDGGALPGHLDRTAAPGIETSGGSLGHGLSLGLGMALGAKRDGSPARVFVLVGDGECNEGSIWEAAMLAPNLGLGNLTVLVDYNKIQSFGRTDEIIDQRNLRERWAAFGWDAQELDGHDFAQLEKALTAPVWPASARDRPAHREGQGHLLHGGPAALALSLAERRGARPRARGARGPAQPGARYPN